MGRPLCQRKDRWQAKRTVTPRLRNGTTVTPGVFAVIFPDKRALVSEI